MDSLSFSSKVHIDHELRNYESKPLSPSPKHVYMSIIVSHNMIDTVVDEPRSAVLRDEFVFKIVPMLNPDGVSIGN